MPSRRQSTKSQKKTLRSRNNRNKRSTLRQKNRRVNRKNKSRSLRQKRRQQGGDDDCIDSNPYSGLPCEKLKSVEPPLKERTKRINWQNEKRKSCRDECFGRFDY